MRGRVRLGEGRRGEVERKRVIAKKSPFYTLCRMEERGRRGRKGKEEYHNFW